MSDLRDLLWSSIDNDTSRIDNDTSRDLDQIEVAERQSNGDVKVLVGIADVDAFVPKQTAIDQHAARETTTVYAGVRNFPMLPEELSTGKTSLLENQDRLSVVIEFVVDGHVTSRNVYHALVRNHAQLQYNSVGTWLEGAAPAPAKVAASTDLQSQLAPRQISSRRRAARIHRLRPRLIHELSRKWSSSKTISPCQTLSYPCSTTFAWRKGGSYLIEWRKFVCGVMIVVAPTSLMSQSMDRGLLHSDGGTWLNGSPAPAISAIFPDSLVQTQAGHSAKINLDGSTVLIGPETIVQFQGNELALDHGALQLDTAREMKVLIGCVTVTPITSDRTQYNVTDVDGKVKVAALKNDVKIHLHGVARRSKQGESSDLIVREGEQATRRDRCGAFVRPTHGDGPILERPVAWGTALVVAGAVACLGLCHGDDPVSPSKP